MPYRSLILNMVKGSITVTAFLEWLDFLALLPEYSGNNAKLQVLKFVLLYSFERGWPTFDFDFMLLK